MTRRFFSRLLIMAAMTMAILTPLSWSYANPGMGDLDALPSCAGACHTNGGFKVDKTTGKKVMLDEQPADNSDEPVCVTRKKCGPLFCRNMQTCCDGDRCKTKPVGKQFPNPDAKDNAGEDPAAEPPPKSEKKPEPDLSRCETFDFSNGGGGGMGCDTGEPICGAKKNNKQTCCCPK